MIYVVILSALAGYFTRAVVGTWKEYRAWQDGYAEGRKQAIRDMANEFENVCLEEIEQRRDTLRDKREVSGP